MERSGVGLLETVRRCCRGDSEAWGEFLPSFQEIGNRTLRSFGLPESDFQDVLSDVLTSLYRGGLGRFRGTTVGELVNFLKRIVLNEAIDFMKQRGRAVSLSESSEHQKDAGRQQPPDSIDVLAEKECMEILRKEVEALKREDQELFLMKWRGLKEREIVEQTGRPPGTVSAQIARLLERLRIRLKERGC